MIYLLTRNGRVNYDEYDAKVVRAPSEKVAREIANARVGDEGQIWTDPERVVCEVVDPDGPSDVILADFNAG